MRQDTTLEANAEPIFRSTSIFGRQYLVPTWYHPALVLVPVVRDLIGLEHLRKRSRRPASAPAPGATVIIARPDHLGDMLQVTALTHALRNERPDLRLTLLHGSWTRELAQLLLEHRLVDGLIEYDHPSLQPGISKGRRIAGLMRPGSSTLVRILRRQDAEVFIDGRITAPLFASAARAASIPQIVGFGLRGGASRYTHLATIDLRSSVPQNWLRLLEPLGISPPKYMGPQVWEAGPSTLEFNVLHPGSQDPAKGAPDRWWASFARGLSAWRPLVVTGTSQDAERFPLLAREVTNAGGELLFGKTSIRAVLDRIAGARAVFAPESFAAHAALGFRKPLGIVHGPQRRPNVALPRTSRAPVAYLDFTKSLYEDGAERVAERLASTWE